MMKYSKEVTLLHPIAQKYPSCVKDLNLIIRKDLKSSADLFTEVETIEKFGDAATIKMVFLQHLMALLLKWGKKW